MQPEPQAKRPSVHQAQPTRRPQPRRGRRLQRGKRTVGRRHYNYFRDYEPGTGRYVESDPIGLRGGVSTYGYVYAGPLIFRDQYGLFGVTDFIQCLHSPYPQDCLRPNPPERPFLDPITPPRPGLGLPRAPAFCRPAPGDPRWLGGGLMASGAAGAALGAGVGIGWGATEAAHLGALGILEVAEATYGGAMLGGTLGLAGGAVLLTGGYIWYVNLPPCDPEAPICKCPSQGLIHRL
jgi:RHS repeat-associated protein